jgi:DNA-binding CsgD family transcriptional regulator
MPASCEMRRRYVKACRPAALPVGPRMEIWFAQDLPDDCGDGDYMPAFWEHFWDCDPCAHGQRELLGLVAAGHTNAQIGRRLGLSEGTVRKHLENIYGRLQVSSRTAAVTRAFPELTAR